MERPDGVSAERVGSARPGIEISPDKGAVSRLERMCQSNLRLNGHFQGQLGVSPPGLKKGLLLEGHLAGVWMGGSVFNRAPGGYTREGMRSAVWGADAPACEQSPGVGPALPRAERPGAPCTASLRPPQVESPSSSESLQALSGARPLLQPTNSSLLLT